MHQLDMLTEVMLQHQNAAREAHVQRRLLIRAAMDQNRVRFYRPALVSLGKRLVTWGIKLQRSDEYTPTHEINFAPSNK